MGDRLGGLGDRISKSNIYKGMIYKKYDLAISTNARHLKAMVRRSDGHTDRRTYGQTARRPDVQKAGRSDGLRLSKTAYDGLTRSKTI